MTRKVILELCAEAGIDAMEADITEADVSNADEVMVLGTMSGPVAVVAIDDQLVGDGTIGSLTRRLSSLYLRAQQDPAQGFEIFK